MNRDSHLLFEAYRSALTEKHLHQGEFAKIEKEAEKRYHSKKAGERVAGAIKAKVEAEDAEHETCVYAEEGCDCDGCAACRANQKSEDAQETDDERYNREAGELEAIMKQHKPDFQHTPFWDAYKAVKDGLWSEEEFHQWASSVWADGADHAQGMGEGEEVPGTEDEEDDNDDTADGDAAIEPGVV